MWIQSALFAYMELQNWGSKVADARLSLWDVLAEVFKCELNLFDPCRLF